MVGEGRGTSTAQQRGQNDGINDDEQSRGWNLFELT